MKRLIGIFILLVLLLVTVPVIADTVYTASVDLSVTIIPSLNEGMGGGTGGGIDYIDDSYVPTNISGVVIRDTEIDSADGVASVELSRWTVAKDKNGSPLKDIRVNPLTSPPAIPAGSNIVGIPYEFIPSGATFNPAITITFKYDPSKVPGGAELKLVFWNGVEWIPLTDVVVDPINGTVSGKTTHFTPFALMAVTKPVEEPKSPISEPTIPDIPIVVVPTIPDKPTTPDKPVVVPTEPTEPTKPEPTPNLPVLPEPEPKGITGFFIGLIVIVLVAALVIVIILRVKLRKKKQ